METYDVIRTPLGSCVAEARDGRLTALRTGAKGKGRRARLPEARRAVADFFAGRRPRAALDLSARSEFERRVYSVVRAIPPGATRTYGEVARAAGNPRAARAVGAAMGRNPYYLIIP